MPDKILTIAGSDSLSGGGIQADLATFSEYGYFGLAVTTAIVTVTTKDFQVFRIAPHIIAEQLNSVLALDDIRAIKIGFLPTVASIEIVAEHLQHIKNIPIIVRNPNSVRPYQHVLEADMFYLMLAMKQYNNKSYAGNYNIGPDDSDCVTTSQLCELFCHFWEGA